MLLDTKSLINNLSTFLHKFGCFKLHLSYILCCGQSQNPILLLSYPAVSSYWYFVLTVIYIKHCKFSIFWIIYDCKLAFLLDIALKMI